MRSLAAIVAGTALALGLLAGCGGADERPTAGDVRAAQRAAPYPVYWVGSSFAGLPLTAITRNGARVSFLYGTCKASGDSGCALPLEIQTTSICDRNAVILDIRPRSSTRVRGVVARDYGEGDRSLEVGESNVTVFGRSPYRERAVGALRPVAGRLRGDRLPRPRYPLAYVAELRRVRAAYRRLGSIRAVRGTLGISKSAVRFRLTLARELGERRLRRAAADFGPGSCALEPAA